MTHLEDFEDDCSPDKPDNTTNEVDTYLIASCGKSRVVIDGRGGGDDPDPPSDAGGGVVVDQDDDGGDPPDPPPPGGPPRPVDPDPCRCYVYDFNILEDSTTLGNTTTFTKTFILYQKCHDFSTGNPENPPETFLWIQDLQHALATGFSGNLNYGGLNSICNCTGPCPTITIVLTRVVIDDDDDTTVPGTPGRPAPRPGTPADVECCLWTCVGNEPTKICKQAEEWRAIYPGTSNPGWQCSDVFNAAPFTVNGKLYTKEPRPCGNIEPGVTPGVGGGDGNDGPPNPTTPGVGTQQGGLSYDICYRWVCQNGTPTQIGRTLNYWRNFTGLDLKGCGDLPQTFTGPNEKLYSTNPAAVCPPGNLGGGVLIDFGGGGNDGPDAAGGLGGFDFDGPDLPGNLGGFQTGIDTGGGGGGGNNTPIDDPGNIAGGSIFGGGGDNDGPNAAGGLGGFDFDGPDLPGNLGGFQTGIDTGGGGGGGGGVGTPLGGDFVGGDYDPFEPPDSGGGGIGGGNPYSWGGGTADSTVFDPPNSGGGGIKGSGISLDIDPFADSGQQFDTQNRISSGDVADSFVLRSDAAYDKNNNIVFTRDPERLAFLRAAANNPLFSDNSIFKRTVYNTLATVLHLVTDRGRAVYNGEEISAFCYDDDVITDGLKPTAADILEKINTANSSSYRFSNYITKALRNAVLRNVIGDYTLDFLREIGAGYNDINPDIRSDSIQVATGYIAQFRKSLYPKNYSKGESQRRVQMWHALPSDIDLKTTIGVSHGGNVCVRVDDTDDLTVSSRSGDVKQVATKNEFYTVIQQDGSEQTIALYSKRKQAYALDLPKLSVAHSLFGGRAGRFGRNGDYNFILKTQTPFEDKVEVSATSTTLKEAYLIKLDKRSIGDVNNDTQYFRQTSATYNLVWQEGDSEEVFTSSVEDYYGPRQVVYVNGRDPFWNHFLSASSVSATYNDLKIDGLLGGIYPRVLNMDILLVPTDQVRYDPYQGNSKLDQYESGKPVIRSLKIVTSPVRKSLGEVYAQLDFDTRRVARQGGVDNYAVKSIKGYSDGYFRKVASNKTTLRTDRSIVGRFINVINRVKENYNLGGRGSGLSLPQRDLYSFMKPREVAEFLIRIPQHVRNSIINGDYTGVRVFAVTNLDREKTFLTPAREKVSGVNLDDERLFKEIQDISSRYFKDIR